MWNSMHVKPAAHFDDGVCKKAYMACDRCRVKKSKCDGARPCSRCRAKSTTCVTRKRNKAHNNVYSREYVEILEQQQVWLTDALLKLYRVIISGDRWPGDQLMLKPNGQPFIDDLLARLDVLSKTAKSCTEQYSDIHGKVPPEFPDAIPKRTQSPAMPLPFLSSSSDNSESNHTAPFSSSITPLDPFGGNAWEAYGPFDASQVAGGFINPLALHTFGNQHGWNFAQVNEGSMATCNKYTFSEDPDMLLFTLNAHVFTNCASLAMDLGSKNEDADLTSVSLETQI